MVSGLRVNDRGLPDGMLIYGDHVENPLGDGESRLP